MVIARVSKNVRAATGMQYGQEAEQSSRWMVNVAGQDLHT